MIHVYIDNEFDAVRMQGRYLQQVIAIGACLCDDAFVHIDSFYSLVCPAGFRRLSPHVRRMTHLKDTEIQKASKFPQVADRFIAWLQHFIIMGANSSLPASSICRRSCPPASAGAGKYFIKRIHWNH